MNPEVDLKTDVSRFGLDDWLAHIQQQHWRTIDLKLDRVSAVWRRLGDRPADLVVAVAGTNGKGSCVAMLDACLRTAGMSTGSYTSPHLVRYNERVTINGEPVSDKVLVDTFAEIESARKSIPLTYFEFGTVCALRIFSQYGVDACILETGMGGRLDATNIVANDVTLITSIGLDHQQWLGHDRETIGREKAGLIKNQGLAVCSDEYPPASILETAAGQNATLIQTTQDCSLTHEDDGTLTFRSLHPAISQKWQYVPDIRPVFAGMHQRLNLAGVIATLGALANTRPIDVSCLQGLQEARITGRCQLIDHQPVTILDVAHNADSAASLANMLTRYPVSGIRYAVFGALADKELAPIVESLDQEIDQWFLAAIPDERGQSAEALQEKLLAIVPGAETCCFKDAMAAFRAATELAGDSDRVVAFGSFHIVGDILAGIKEEFIDGK